MEEFVMEEKMVGFSKKDATYIAKGKRTKRLRFLSPCGVVAMASSCSSDESNIEVEDEDDDDEEEDLAKCLILLAQGGNHRLVDENKREKGSHGNKKIGETSTKLGLYIYECKTCNRTFPSFQALGGHRASHKKPKIMAEEKKPPSQPSQQPRPQSSSHDSQSDNLVANSDEYEEAEKPRGPMVSFQMGNHGLKAAINGNKAKIHECSICGSEFTSGQALGGHMRRHRVSVANAAAVAAPDERVRPRNILQLDLNLPAPEEDIRESKFQFPATQKSMVMAAAPALVGCHY